MILTRIQRECSQWRDTKFYVPRMPLQACEVDSYYVHLIRAKFAKSFR